MKILGLILVIMACTAMGISVGEELKYRVYCLGEIQLFVKILKSEIAYAGTPLAEAVCELAGKGKFGLEEYFQKVVEEMKKRDGRQLEKVMIEEGQKFLVEKKLTEKDLKSLAKAAGRMGHSNREIQLRIMEMYLLQLEAEMEQIQEKIHRNEKMYRFLGFMGGLFFAILLY